MSDWLTQITDTLSYWSIALLMFAENVFPPIPSEVVMPSAGFAAQKGEMSFLGIVTAGSVGSLAGLTLWYFIGRWVGEERLYRWIDRHGKWIAVRVGETKRAVAWFRRWGSFAVLLCRMVPGLRTLISVPAGFAEMNFVKFIIYSAIGTVLWNVVLAALGWYLRDNYKVVTDYLGWIGLAVVGLLVLWWLVRLIRRHSDSAPEPAA